MSAVLGWIRPWFPAGRVGHIDPECPELLKWVSEPVEGPGWLDPYAEPVQGSSTCEDCLERAGLAPIEPPSWDACCDTCYASMSDWADGPFDEKAANDWRDDHRCETDIRIIAPEIAKKAAR